MTRSALVVLSLVCAAACSDVSGGTAGPGGTGGAATGGSSGSGASATGGTGGASIDSGPNDGSGGSAAGPGCDPPDMLIVLDMSMHRRPDGSVPPDTTQGHAESKWYLAVTAVEALTAQLDQTIRFGLELFPRNPGGTVCVTLSERISGLTATNPICEAGEIAVAPALASSAAVAAAIDPETTRLCNSTPIGAGLQTATQELAKVKVAGRDQYALLIGDGQDSCDEALVMSAAHALAQSGVKLFVIGFDAAAGTGVNKAALNQLACAGRTAKGFPAPCSDDGQGNYTATNPDGEVLYLLAENGTALGAALSSVAGQICCGCVQ